MYIYMSYLRLKLSFPYPAKIYNLQGPTIEESIFWFIRV